MTFPLDALDINDPTAGLKRAKKVSSHTSFFKAGTCLGRTLVCVVKASALSSTIKTLEPIDQNVRGKNKPTFRKLLQGGNDTLRVFKEFYIPTESSSIHFLKTKLCVGCTKGFEIVDLETLDTQGLLDPADASLDFVQKKENTRPIAIYRIENEFLLCYDGECGGACGCQYTDALDRFCILCQQKWMAGPSKLDRSLGGMSHFIWYVTECITWGLS